MKKKIFSVFLVFAVILIFSGCGCKENTSPKYKISLEIWGPLDDGDALYPILENYKKLNPQVYQIQYKKIAYDTYKKELLDALASGQGPDILMIHNDWRPDFSNKIVPVPEVIPGEQAEINLNEQKFRQDFVDVAAKDFLDQGKIWAVPMSVNSLGLFYNKDLFNAAGIASPPKNWGQFIADVEKLTQVDMNGEITRSGAAIGTAFNINRSTDLLTLLMLQNKTEIVDQNGSVTISNGKPGMDGRTVVPAENALNFYTSFAKRGDSHYSWNSNMHYSVDSFAEGVTAMMFNYSWQAQTIDQKAPKLNYAVAPVPQFEDSLPVSYANYWGYAVAKNKIINSEQGASNYSSSNVTNDIRVKEAWKLLAFLATKPDQNIQLKSTLTGSSQVVAQNYDPAAEYLKTTNQPAARRDLIEVQKTDPKLGVFATGNLIAANWTRNEPEAIEAIFAEMINQVNLGQSLAREAVETAAQRMMKLTGGNSGI